MSSSSSSSNPVSPRSESNPSSNSNRNVDQYENPYYLHSSDHAGLQLVVDRLTTGADFHSWRRSVSMALNVRNKLGFVNGKVKKPPDSHKDSGSWSRCNDMVATWLLNSVSKKIGQSLLYMSTAEDIWKNLLSRFKQDDAPRVFEIEQRLNTLQQGSMDISSYYTELVTMWEEYKNYIELPICTCGKCECNAALLWEQLQHRSRVIRFLMGLNESYEQTRRHILMLKPIPSIEEVYNMVAQDERQKNIKPVLKIDNVAFQASEVSDGSFGQDQMELAAAYNTYRPRNVNRPMCTYCGQLGHVAAKCFKLHGYPPGYKVTQPQNTYAKPQPSFQPRGATGYGQRPPFRPPSPAQFQNKPIANVFSEGTTSVQNMEFNGNQYTPEQMMQLVQQLQSQIQVSEAVANPTLPSITEHGVMAVQSSAGVFSGLDDWEG